MIYDIIMMWKDWGYPGPHCNLSHATNINQFEQWGHPDIKICKGMCIIAPLAMHQVPGILASLGPRSLPGTSGNAYLVPQWIKGWLHLLVGGVSKL